MVLVPLEGMSASSPFPSAFLCMIHHLPRQFPITFGARAVWVVENDRLSKRRSLAQADIPGDHRLVDPLREKLPRLVSDLLGEIEASVEHREKHSLDSKPRVEMVLNQADRRQQRFESL